MNYRSFASLVPFLSCFATALPVLAAPPDAPFEALADRLVLECMTSPTELAECGGGPTGLASSLEWRNASLLVREVVAGARRERSTSNTDVSLRFAPVYSYAGTTGTVMTVLRFAGSVLFNASNKSFEVRQDNAGDLFARSLYLREEREFRFLLPAMFVERESGTRSHGVLTFNCDAFLDSCEPPQVGFAEYLADLGRRCFGFPQIMDSPSDVPSPPAFLAREPACCFNSHSGSCHCQFPACRNLNCPERLPACQDCDAFTCNCE